MSHCHKVIIDNGIFDSSKLPQEIFGQSLKKGLPVELLMRLMTISNTGSGLRDCCE
ncbi:MAG: hypothetical protein ACMUIU_04500 [bacterium]